MNKSNKIKNLPDFIFITDYTLICVGRKRLIGHSILSFIRPFKIRHRPYCEVKLLFQSLQVLIRKNNSAKIKVVTP
jgi:hypothetical protein